MYKYHRQYLPRLTHRERANLMKCIRWELIYIYNCPLQPFSQDYGRASHTTHVVCVNFIREWRDLQFNVDSERQIF